MSRAKFAIAAVIVLGILLVTGLYYGGVFWGETQPNEVANPKVNVIDQLLDDSPATEDSRFLDDDPSDQPPSPRPDLIAFPSLVGSSHQKMIQALQKIKDLNLYEQSFYGDVSLAQDEYQLSLSPAEDIQGRFKQEMRIGTRKLWLGDTDLSIENFQRALNLVIENQDKVPTNVVNRAMYQLGLAYLRMAENQNCVDCNNGESCLVPISVGGQHKFTTGSENAIIQLTELLTRDPENVAAKWLYNLASMTLGRYPTDVPDQWRIPEERFKSDADFPRFENVATKLGLSTINLSGGVVWDDFDGDGDLDLLTSSWGHNDPLHYFQNQGGGKFIDRTAEANLTGIMGGLNLIQADYDNDGDMDVLVLRGAWMEDLGRIPNSLLQNDGTGRFTDVTFDAGLANNNYPTQTAVWLDIENDGDLDLFVGNEKYPCQLFQNNGMGQFKDIAKTAGVQNFRFSKSVVSGDVNADGFADLFVSNHGQANRLYINDQTGTFTDRATEHNVSAPKMSFPAWFWDYNNDGNLDLFVSGYSYGQTFVSETYFDTATSADRNYLYQGTADHQFIEVAIESNLTTKTQTMGCNYGDLDNDGFLDFYLGTGCPSYDTLMPNLMYLNQRGKRFANVTTNGGFGHLQKGHAIAFADIDNDGDQDVFAEMGGAFPGDAAANAVYQNPGMGNRWITVKLVGTKTNRSAIGARIAITIDDPESDSGIRRIFRWVGSGASFGANPLRQEIGLGQADTIQRLEVFWPVTGETQTFQNLPTNQFIQIVEGENEIRPMQLPN